MAATPMLGSLIRETRKRRGVTQAALAQRCEISASYLNLIEHDRRKVGGALLNRLAGELEVDPRELSAGVGRRMQDALHAAAARHADAGADLDRLEEFAGRYPGWARLIAAQERSEARLGETVGALSDRLANDPFLSAAVHDMLSSVTSIRSTSAILREDDAIAPEWQARFHRNISEDSERLSQSVERLVRHMDASAAQDAVAFPEEALDEWLDARGWAIDALEDAPGMDAGALFARSGLDDGARGLFLGMAERYADDVRMLPREALLALLGEGLDPAQIAARSGAPLPVVMRRLAAMPPEAFPDRQARGLVSCDAAGALRTRKTVPGFDIPRFGAACAVWPLFEALQRPGHPVMRVAEVAGRYPRRFRLTAIADARYPGGLEAAPVVEAFMLIAPLSDDGGTAATDIGATCRICAAAACPARREPAVVATA